MLMLLTMALLSVCQGSEKRSETPQGYCSFPAFLWKTNNGGGDSHRKWISKTEHVLNTDLWEKQKVITAKETELSVQHKLHASCRGHQADSEVPCFRQQINYRIICISVEPDEKFRVRQYVNGALCSNGNEEAGSAKTVLTELRRQPSTKTDFVMTESCTGKSGRGSTVVVPTLQTRGVCGSVAKLFYQERRTLREISFISLSTSSPSCINEYLAINNHGIPVIAGRGGAGRGGAGRGGAGRGGAGRGGAGRGGAGRSWAELGGAGWYNLNALLCLPVPVQEEWTFCPFKGGFDFRAFTGNTGEEVCGDIWQPARMESECVKGEGATFHFPKESCSPFSPQRQEQTLYCWASWQEASYTFIILAEADQLPRYVLRLPAAPEEGRPMTAFLYFSLVVPLSGSGQPPGPVGFFRMQMNRSEEGTCYDESPKCAKFSEQGRCTNDEAEPYASHCMRSCALCRLVAVGKGLTADHRR
ncbi:hypothetical protein LSAT2_024416 [Lamellibrachia satsuma]|nr:hypothetical protein LSAT2_024416 [Lamellibrachia satsuma]